MWPRVRESATMRLRPKVEAHRRWVYSGLRSGVATPNPHEMGGTRGEEHHRDTSTASEPHCVHGAGGLCTLRDEKGGAQASNDLVPCDEGATGRGRRRRKLGNQATPRGKDGTEQSEIRTRIRTVEAARQDHNLRDTSLQSSAMGDGIRTDRTASDQHMAVGRQASHLTTEPRHGVGAKATTGTSKGNTTRSEGATEEGSTTEHEQGTEAGNGTAKNSRVHKKNHFSVFFVLC